jgi:hypothetical protein
MLKINGLYQPMLANRIITGQVYWLGTTSSTRNIDGQDMPSHGDDPRRPFASLDYALSKCTANNDDAIVILAGHTETLTGAGGLTLDVAGVSIIGMGRYDARPRFLLDGSTITGLVTAANVSIENCIFASGHSDVACALLVTGKGFRIEGCRFELNTTNENFVNYINGGGGANECDGLEIINNVFDSGVDIGMINPIDILYNANDVKIIGNKIMGDFQTTPYAAIYAVNTVVLFNLEIGWNMIHNLHNANAVVGISAGSTASTGWMHHNMVYALDTNGGTPFVSAATGIAMWDNKYVHAANVSAYQMPTLGTYAG